MILNKEHISIMEHTSNRAARGLYCGDSKEMKDLVESGLMEPAGKVDWVPDPYFRLTHKGKLRLDRMRKGEE